MARFRFIFIVLYLTVVLIFTVYLRSRENNLFYQLYTTSIRQKRLEQSLCQKQLQLESLINPAALSKRMKE